MATLAAVASRGPWILALALLTLLAWVGPVTAQADASDAAITGRVLDASSGEPVDQAMVSLESLGWGVFTDGRGRFRMSDVPSGTGVLLVERLGYGSATVDVEVGREGADVTVRLPPDPVVLEGVSVVTNRFERRRKATSVSVRAFDQSDLLSSGVFPSVLDFIETRAGVPMVDCPPRARSFNCVLVRGQRREVGVYIDEAPAVGGLDQLETYRPGDFYMIEVFAGGRHIRAYTHSFMRRAAQSRLYPIPLFF